MSEKLIVFGLAAALVASIQTGPAFANGYGEDVPWQFQTTADMANLAAVESLIQQKRAGGFGPAGTTNNITTNNTSSVGTENDCNVTPTSTGNAATNGESADNPLNSGSTATATGNQASSSTSTDGSVGNNQVQNGQTTHGHVGATTVGNNSSTSSNAGTLGQTLTNTQTNTAPQTAINDIHGTACSFSGTTGGAVQNGGTNIQGQHQGLK
jgi:hypothetical protein